MVNVHAATFRVYILENRARSHVTLPRLLTLHLRRVPDEPKYLYAVTSYEVIMLMWEKTEVQISLYVIHLLETLDAMEKHTMIMIWKMLST